MSKVYLDTSVLVPALTDQLANHEVALSCLQNHLSGKPAISSHGLAESFATLTALPLPHRITPGDAAVLLGPEFQSHFHILTLDVTDYSRAIDRTCRNGLRSGQVYDALHVEAAIRGGCSRILSYNLDHFRKLCPPEIEVSTP